MNACHLKEQRKARTEVLCKRMHCFRSTQKETKQNYKGSIGKAERENTESTSILRTKGTKASRGKTCAIDFRDTHKDQGD